jgi:ABC-type phosphate/phosphonate transport system substrate-binding protein
MELTDDMIGLDVAALTDDWIHKSTQENANLIAAAPELLKVLEDALKYWIDDTFDEEYPDRIEWADKARAAIAKARGE